MELHPIDVDRCSHNFMNSIPYPKGGFNVLTSYFWKFTCKCGIRTEINSLFIRGGANAGNQIVPSISRRYFCGFFAPFFKKVIRNLWQNALLRLCRQQRGKSAALRQEQSVSCQSKILPRCHNSLFAHSVPSESCWGVPSQNPAVTAYAAVVPLAATSKIYFYRWLRFLKKMSIER